MSGSSSSDRRWTGGGHPECALRSMGDRFFVAIATPIHLGGRSLRIQQAANHRRFAGSKDEVVSQRLLATQTLSLRKRPVVARFGLGVCVSRKVDRYSSW